MKTLKSLLPENCTIAHCTIQSYNLSLKVDFLFQSFLVITVVLSLMGGNTNIFLCQNQNFETSLDLILVKGTVEA